MARLSLLLANKRHELEQVKRGKEEHEMHLNDIAVPSANSRGKSADRSAGKTRTTRRSKRESLSQPAFPAISEFELPVDMTKDNVSVGSHELKHQKNHGSELQAINTHSNQQIGRLSATTRVRYKSKTRKPVRSPAVSQSHQYSQRLRTRKVAVSADWFGDDCFSFT